MPNNTNKAKSANNASQYKTYNPTKSKVGKVIIVILAAGMFLGILVAAIIGIINSFS
jgi:uncharacterized protein involved in exopolysaccharide biosynthesis